MIHGRTLELARQLNQILSHLDALDSFLIDDRYNDIWLGMWRARRIDSDPVCSLFGLAKDLRYLADLVAMRAADLAVTQGEAA